MLVHNIINRCSALLISMPSFDGLVLSWKSLLPQDTEHTVKHRSLSAVKFQRTYICFRLIFLDLQLIKEQQKYKIFPPTLVAYMVMSSLNSFSSFLL